MYDELVKRLREVEEMLRVAQFNEAKSLIKEAADAIEELDNKLNLWRHDKISRWIPVTERLPESGVPTLICGDGNIVEQGFFDDEYGYWYDWGGNRTFAHHWMPLPEPPKEE